MTSPSSSRLAAAAAFVLLISMPVRAADAQPVAAATEPGDLWEVTSQMSMERMPMAMPAQTQRVCAAKDWKEPPGPKDDRHKCETTDFTTTGATVNWKVRCAGPPAMTGEGEITRQGSDAYSGLMRFTSPDGIMTMKLNGRRVGECDAGENKRQVAKLQAQVTRQQQDSAAAQTEMCRQLATGMNLQALKSTAGMCDEAAFKAVFCERLETVEGFTTVASCRPGEDKGLDEGAAYCGKNPQEIRQVICAEALEKRSLDLLGRCCPTESQSIAQEECAGSRLQRAHGLEIPGVLRAVCQERDGRWRCVPR